MSAGVSERPQEGFLATEEWRVLHRHWLSLYHQAVALCEGSPQWRGRVQTGGSAQFSRSRVTRESHPACSSVPRKQPGLGLVRPEAAMFGRLGSAVGLQSSVFGSHCGGERSKLWHGQEERVSKQGSEDGDIPLDWAKCRQLGISHFRNELLSL